MRRWVIWGPILETRRPRLRGRYGVAVSVGEIRMISPTWVVCVWVEVILWARVKVLHGFGILNSLVNGIALSSNKALEATHLTQCPNLKNIAPEELLT